MKKSTIKRRKRVIPASHGLQPGFEDTESAESGSPSPEAVDQRGLPNADGSINLGLRRDPPGHTILPPIEGHRPHQLPSGDLTAYASNANTQTQQQSEYLNDDNRLPPMTAYQPARRPQSLSSNTFLSPSRKRSFSSAEIEAREPSPGTEPKRLSSIKSILNDPNAAGARSPRASEVAKVNAGRRPGGLSPGQEVRAGSRVESPSSRGEGPDNTAGRISSRDAQGEERRKAERRERLQKEAEKMREALLAKERELEELGEDDD